MVLDILNVLPGLHVVFIETMAQIRFVVNRSRGEPRNCIVLFCISLFDQI